MELREAEMKRRKFFLVSCLFFSFLSSMLAVYLFVFDYETFTKAYLNAMRLHDDVDYHFFIHH